MSYYNHNLLIQLRETKERLEKTLTHIRQMHADAHEAMRVSMPWNSRLVVYEAPEEGSSSPIFIKGDMIGANSRFGFYNSRGMAPSEAFQNVHGYSSSSGSQGETDDVHVIVNAIKQLNEQHQIWFAQAFVINELRNAGYEVTVVEPEFRQTLI